MGGKAGTPAAPLVGFTPSLIESTGVFELNGDALLNGAPFRFSGDFLPPEATGTVVANGGKAPDPGGVAESVFSSFLIEAAAPNENPPPLAVLVGAENAKGAEDFTGTEGNLTVVCVSLLE